MHVSNKILLCGNSKSYAANEHQKCAVCEQTNMEVGPTSCRFIAATGHCVWNPLLMIVTTQWSANIDQWAGDGGYRKHCGHGQAKGGMGTITVGHEI